MIRRELLTTMKDFLIIRNASDIVSREPVIMRECVIMMRVPVIAGGRVRIEQGGPCYINERTCDNKEGLSYNKGGAFHNKEKVCQSYG